MKILHGLLVAAAFTAGLTTVEAGDLKLTIADGKVTLVCDNVTARQILAEWARIGQTKVVNAEKLAGPPLTLRLEGVPEKQALDVVLRASSGFMIAERPVADAALSRYDRILVMPPSTPVATSADPAGSRVPAPPSPAPPTFAPAPPPEPADDQADDPPPAGDARPPETTFDYANPQEFLRRRQEMMQQQQQQQGPPSVFPGTVLPTQVPPGGAPAAPSGLPTAPAGTSRPGEIVKPPQQNPATYANPYGLPYNVQPGSVPSLGMEPDRAKYANPYQPTPRPPQDQDD